MPIRTRFSVSCKSKPTHVTCSTMTTSPDHSCSIAATLAVVGDRWSLLILRQAFRGDRRFSEFADELGIAKNLLSSRLRSLVESDVLEKVLYQEHPARYEYRLTPRGLELSGALIALMHWGDRWYADGGPPTVLTHDACGTALQHHVWCPDCDSAVGPTQIRSTPGPGVNLNV